MAHREAGTQASVGLEGRRGAERNLAFPNPRVRSRAGAGLKCTMGKAPARTVYRRSDGNWVNKLNGNERASSLHGTQKAANDAAKAMLQKAGGGERTTMGVNHLI